MKKLLISLIFLPLLSFGPDRSAPTLNGAYQLVQVNGLASGKADPAKNQQTIKLLYNGHWTTLYQLSPSHKPGIKGGTYQVKDNKYHETKIFDSHQLLAGGSTLSFDYTLEKGKWLLRNFMSSEHSQKEPHEEYTSLLLEKEPLTYKNLEGVWQLRQTANGPASGADGIVKLKYYVYPMFVSLAYHPLTGQVIHFIGGRYFYDGKQVVEKVEYSSLSEVAAGSVHTTEITLHDHSFEQQSLDNNIGAYPEQHPSHRSNTDLWISAIAE